MRPEETEFFRSAVRCRGFTSTPTAQRTWEFPKKELQLGLIKRNRIFTVSVLLPDKPGELVRVASIIAAQNGNVIKLEHNQFVTTNRTAAVELKITIEAFGTEHKDEICRALTEAGYTPQLISVLM